MVLQPDDVPEGDEREKHVLLTVQPRVPVGGLKFVELPAGMVDGEGTFAGAAAREMQEELGLEIKEAELVNLSELAIQQEEGTGQGAEEVMPKAMFPSAGGCDEFVSLFLYEKRVPRGQLKEWTGRLTGLREEGERITLLLVKMEELWIKGARDAKALGALALYTGLKGYGKI